jgi:selenocysteine lyase/cysteine desulfurase
VGDDVVVPCVDGVERVACGFDAAASTAALPAVAQAVTEMLPLYSSVHRGAGWKSQRATAAYEAARHAVLRFAGRPEDGDDVAVLCRNTTEAINHIAYRLGLDRGDVVVTTVVEHHANLLPWGRVATRRYVDCGVDGTFTLDDVLAALDDGPAPALLAITGASNVTGWLPPIDAIIDAAHDRGVPVIVDAAQVAPHRPLPLEADFLAFSGHKLYAPFGTSAFIGPRGAFAEGDPFLAGGGAVDLVDLDEVVWTDPPEREEAGSPNVMGAVALHAALDELLAIGWDAIAAHEHAIGARLRGGLAAIDGVHLLGPAADSGIETLALATFVVEGVSHGLVAARLSAEHGIATRHGCFCAHPYLLRLLGLSTAEVAAYRADVLRGERRYIPGAVRASAGINTTDADVDRLLDAVARIAGGEASPVEYEQDDVTGDWWPLGDLPGWSAADRALGASCARG